jgi:hypothetical protein
VQQPNHIPTEELQQLPSTYRDFRLPSTTSLNSRLPFKTLDLAGLPTTSTTKYNAHLRRGPRCSPDLPVSLLSFVPASFFTADYRQDSRWSLLLLLTAAAEECVHVKRIPDAATADAAIRKAMQIYSRPTHAPLHRQIRETRKSRTRARGEREKMTSERAQRWRAPQETTRGGGGGGGPPQQGAGLPGSQSGSGTRAARNGGTEATGAVRRFHPDTFHPSTSLFEFTSHEKLGDGK